MSDVSQDSTAWETPSTAALADAILTRGSLPRVAPKISALRSGTRVAGRAHPVVHRGSVDVILEAISSLETGEVLVVDDGGRRDRACVGDLIALEAWHAGAAAMVVWGTHRDSAQLADIELPIYTLGSCPTGPLPNDPADEARHNTLEPRIGETAVGPTDVVVADDDGVLIVAADLYAAASEEAARIQAMEAAQASQMRSGRSLRDQVRFTDFLEHRSRVPHLTFRDHLAAESRAIER